MDSRQRRKAESAADFLEAWSVAVLRDEFIQVVEYLALSLRQWEH
jgi:hypothetical protein